MVGDGDKVMGGRQCYDYFWKEMNYNIGGVRRWRLKKAGMEVYICKLDLLNMYFTMHCFGENI